MLIDGNKDYLMICLKDIQGKAADLGLSLNMKKDPHFKLPRDNFLGPKFHVSVRSYHADQVHSNRGKRSEARNIRDMVFLGRMTAEGMNVFLAWSYAAKATFV